MHLDSMSFSYLEQASNNGGYNPRRLMHFFACYKFRNEILGVMGALLEYNLGNLSAGCSFEVAKTSGMKACLSSAEDGQ